jgi:pyridoxal phosphate enzyme (YggS family)
MDYISIGSNVEKINAKIASAAARSGRSPADITLIAVTKTVGAEQVREAYTAGIRNFGENRAQELKLKRSQLDDLDCIWHFIGHLQTNKAKDALANASLIHSVDSLPLAAEIGRRAGSVGVPADILAQINISEEESKSGIGAAEAFGFVEALSQIGNIRIRGLMAIARLAPDPENVRPQFRLMKRIFDEIALRIRKPDVSMEYLSMGMSGDFEVAIEEGSNMVRVGTAIFGERHYD